MFMYCLFCAAEVAQKITMRGKFMVVVPGTNPCRKVKFVQFNFPGVPQILLWLEILIPHAYYDVLFGTSGKLNDSNLTSL